MKQQFILAGIILCLLTALFAKTYYSDNTVLVVLTPEASNPTETLPPSFFKGIEIKQVENISLIHNEMALHAIQARGSQYRAIYKLTLTSNDLTKVLEVIEQLNKLPGIAYATPNYRTPLATEPNDEFYSTQWGLHGEHGIRAPQAWDITTGSHNVRVGVIDTGIANHPDLNANVTTGWDFINNNDITTDDEVGHGTHVAGIIGAVADNGMGVAGVNWNITLVPLQVSNIVSESTFIVDDVLAITYATNTWGTSEQISALNFSFAYYGKLSWDPRLPAINNYPGLFIWGAGNENEDVDTSYITNFNLSNLIAVGAIDTNGQKSSFSSYSSGGYVHIFAPGSGIASTVPGNDYDFKDGTSMATPFVTGVAALLLSVDPTLTAAELKQLIIDGADQIIINTFRGPLIVNKLNAFHSLQLLCGLPFLSISPASHYFGAVNIDEASPDKTFSICVQGNSTYTIDSITITGDDAQSFNLSVYGLPWVLNTGDTGTFTVSFSPTSLGVKNANIIIYSNADTSPHIVSISGTGWLESTSLPYTQDFNNVISLNEISWSGDLYTHSGFFPYSGVYRTKGLALRAFEPQTAVTPTFEGITAKAHLSFAYRIVLDDGSFILPVIKRLDNTEKLYIEVSTTGTEGIYNVIHEINNTNHTPSLLFHTVNLPLGTYASEDINIRFRAEIGGYCIIDDVYICNYAPPASITANVHMNNVTLSWTAPFDTEDIVSYSLHRGDTHLIDLPATTLNFTNQNVALGTYYYSVRAVYAQGISTPTKTTVYVPQVLPYLETFDQGGVFHVIDNWGFSSSQFGVLPGYGVYGTTGLVILQSAHGNNPQQGLYTPVILGITEQTALSFAYRIIDDTSDWDGEYTASTLSWPYAVFIEVSTNGGAYPTATYDTIHLIDHFNHITSSSFATMVLPLSAYSGEAINIKFRIEVGINGHAFVLDDVYVNENITLQPPQNLIATRGDNIIVLAWQAPTNGVLLGYKVYRDGSALSDIINAFEYQDDTALNEEEYTYYVSTVYSHINEVASEPVTVQPVSENDEVVVPLVTGLGGNYPNPFNPETVIRFVLTRAEVVAVDVYNIRGQKVRSLASGVYEAGVHNVVWNGCDDVGKSVGSGIYFYRMVAGEYRGVRKMVLMK